MRCAVISHDAGGAEILSSYVAQNHHDYLFTLCGPAVSIFNRKLGTINTADIETVITNSDLVICGTSWQSDLEVQAIQLAKILGIKSVSVLDHWVNYKERFTRNSTITLPDELWVCDDNAQQLARSIFPDTPVKLINNYYLDEFRANYLASQENQTASGLVVLFIGENISGNAQRSYGDPLYFGYNEFTALNYFAQNFNKLKHCCEKILIRPHPSEDLGKYDSFLKELPVSISHSGGNNLIEDLHAATTIIGISSMALALASLTDKPVISIIPPGFPLPPWPFKNIRELRNM